MSAQSQPRLSDEQYLAIERASEVKHEFYRGQMHAMAGASFRHVMLGSNIHWRLRTAIEGRPCSVGASDLRVRIAPGGLYAYPDLVVVCGDPQFADDQHDTLLNPTVIVEILSPSSEAYDRGFKSAQYRTIGSLQEYVLVSQTEPRVEVFLRQVSGTWVLTEAVGVAGVCRLESIGCEIPLAQIYEKIAFDEEAPGSTPPAS